MKHLILNLMLTLIASVILFGALSSRLTTAKEVRAVYVGIHNIK